MLSFVIRCLGLIVFAAGVIAAVADGIKSIGADSWVVTSLAQTWPTVDAASYAAVSQALLRLPAPLGSFIATTVFGWPAFALLGSLGIALMLLGARRPAQRRLAS